MNNLIFPEGITYKYKYTTGGDFIPEGHSVSGSMSYAYASSKNYIIDISYDTSNVTDMSYMFSKCSSLTSISELDTSNVTNMSYMFDNCSSLTSISELDTSNVTNMNYMFSYCSSLTSIPELDCNKVSNISTFFGFSEIKTITDLGGFKDLGASSSLSGTSDNYFLVKAPNLTHTSIMNVINNLYDRKTAGYSVLTLKLHADTLALLSDEEKAIATNKGWTLS